jgi:hypothetical protein
MKAARGLAKGCKDPSLASIPMKRLGYFVRGRAT